MKLFTVLGGDFTAGSYVFRKLHLRGENGPEQIEPTRLSSIELITSETTANLARADQSLYTELKAASFKFGAKTAAVPFEVAQEAERRTKADELIERYLSRKLAEREQTTSPEVCEAPVGRQHPEVHATFGKRGGV